MSFGDRDSTPAWAIPAVTADTVPNDQPTILVALAAIRWVNGNQAGVELIRMTEEDQLRLRSFVGVGTRRPVPSQTWSEKVMCMGGSGV